MAWNFSSSQPRPKLDRKSDGKLWAFTSVGSYPIVYLCADGGTMCPNCANGEHGSEASEDSEDPQWKLIGADVHWEGAPIQCDHCGADIESAYGDPEAETVCEECGDGIHADASPGVWLHDSGHDTDADHVARPDSNDNQE